jgi:uncharacterized protein
MMSKEKRMLRIALFGAGGRIGSRIMSEALDRGHGMTAVIRDPGKAAGIDPRARIVVGDVLDPGTVKNVASEQDVVVSAVGGGNGSGNQATIEPAARSLVEGLRSLGMGGPRLVTVGGAGSLSTPDGGQVWDKPGLPADLLQTMRAHGDALEFFRSVDDVDWTNVSPAVKILPGLRTGTYRLANDDLITDSEGNSTISFEDYAVAVLDEIEGPRHSRCRFAVAY